MKKLSEEKILNNDIKHIVYKLNSRDKKYPSINLAPSKNRKINLKKSYYYKNFTQLKNYYTSVNSSEKSNDLNNINLISNISDNKHSKIKLKKNLTFDVQDAYPNLTNEYKRELKLIINNFEKNKVVTKQLFNQEKRLRLNSINESNYFFLLNKKSKTKGRNNIPKITKTDLSASSMITKFNNKTFGILDISNPEKKYSKNLTNLTKHIINNFSDKINIGNDFEYSRMKNKNAMNNLELFDDLYIKKAFETEKKFYLAKYNQLMEQDSKNEDKDYSEIKKEPPLIKISIKENTGNNDKIRKEEKTKSLRNKKTLNKLNLDFINNKRRHKSIINTPILLSRNSNNQLIKIDNHKNTLKRVEDKKNSHKTNTSNEINNTYHLKYRKHNDKYKSNLNMESLVKDFYKIYNKKRIQKIKERSKDYADSIAELNYMQYEPMNQYYMNVNNNNLERAIKINVIKKYMHNVQDDDLLIYNPKALRDEILKTQMKSYKVNFNKKYNFNFIKQKFRPKTIRKFAYIKDSYFGIPC